MQLMEYQARRQLTFKHLLNTAPHEFPLTPVLHFSVILLFEGLSEMKDLCVLIGMESGLIDVCQIHGLQTKHQLDYTGAQS